MTEIHGACALPCGELHRVEKILQVGKKEPHSCAWKCERIYNFDLIQVIFRPWIFRVRTKCEGDLPFHPDTVVYLEGNEVPVYGTASSEDDFACPK